MILAQWFFTNRAKALNKEENKMIIRIFKKDVSTRYIEIEEEAALPLFNLILQSLDRDEEVVLFSDDSEEHVVATGC